MVVNGIAIHAPELLQVVFWRFYSGPALVDVNGIF
jgi:hypothetical protein